MKNTSYDSQDWARLVHEIEQAKAACEQPGEVRAESGREEKHDGNNQIASTFARHELADVLDELPNMDVHASEDMRQPHLSSIRIHLGWGIGGFLLGAIFWHLVGFWGFIGDVVFSGPQNSTVVERTVAPLPSPRVLSYLKKRPPGPNVTTSRNCSAFYQDSETGLAHATRCQTVVRALGRNTGTR